jgi:hypothetical protein
MMAEIIETETAHVVIGNTDLTEGRGGKTFEAYTFSLTTARRLASRRYVMGSDSPIEQHDIYRIGNQWYGPITLTIPSEKDNKADREIAEKNALLAKLEKANLSKEEWNLLKGVLG